jgi:Ser/Thr protein kinase RdoA (MazF antagonist)
VALHATTDSGPAAERMRAFVHAYVAQAPLTRDECLAMPELYWAYRVHSLWLYEEHYRKGSARTDHLAMEDIAVLEWWLQVQHRQELARRLVQILQTAPQGTIFTARA